MIILDMDKPSDCEHCPLKNTIWGKYHQDYDGCKYETCPIKGEISNKHGRFEFASTILEAN